ncbi:hypothetical protein CBM2589_A60093 [Cupriavidus taiwanensis]|uniref:Uncharacterized protein n=1 Tax=Cupriavidus taiwanensis TaxID=164546 RepID=A0A375C569_9BURK|nr:hypothetical protein CBM2589_A60093 [Cupriavidus taiwanensis]
MGAGRRSQCSSWLLLRRARRRPPDARCGDESGDDGEHKRRSAYAREPPSPCERRQPGLAGISPRAPSRLAAAPLTLHAPAMGGCRAPVQHRSCCPDAGPPALLLHGPGRLPAQIFLSRLARGLAEIVAVPGRKLLFALARRISRRHLGYIRPFLGPRNLMCHDALLLAKCDTLDDATAMPGGAARFCAPDDPVRRAVLRGRVRRRNLGAQICLTL